MNAHFEQLKARVQLGQDVWIAPNATVLGSVTLGNEVSVWYNAVLRGDCDSITIGDQTNIQENVIMHVDQGVPLSVGKEVIIGHGAVLHGCTVGDNCLIGIRSTILNHARIGKGCIIGANALVTERAEIPDYSMVLGSPGKVVKQLPEVVIDRMREGVQTYIDEARKYLKAEGIELAV